MGSGSNSGFDSGTGFCEFSDGVDIDVSAAGDDIAAEAPWEV